MFSSTAPATDSGPKAAPRRKKRNKSEGVNELMMLLLSVVLGIVPLIGIAWIVLKASVTSVDGLFMSLILMTLSGILFLNAYLEIRGKLKKSAAPPAQKTS
jgi:hypothetical protein